MEDLPQKTEFLGKSAVTVEAELFFEAVLLASGNATPSLWNGIAIVVLVCGV